MPVIALESTQATKLKGKQKRKANEIQLRTQNQPTSRKEMMSIPFSVFCKANALVRDGTKKRGTVTGPVSGNDHTAASLTAVQFDTLTNSDNFVQLTVEITFVSSHLHFPVCHAYHTHTHAHTHTHTHTHKFQKCINCF